MSVDAPEKLYIHGVWSAGDADQITSTSPHDETVVWSASGASAAQAHGAVDAAQSAFPSWRGMPLEDRLRIFHRFGQLVAESKAELARLISLETGKPLWDASGEIDALLGILHVSVQAFHQRTGRAATEFGSAVVETTHRPHGPVLVVGPFNFPVMLPACHIVPALLAGNTVVFKPSEASPCVASAIVSLWEKSGIPPGVLNLVHGGGEVAGQVIDHPAIRGVLLTGGVATGRAVVRRLMDRPEVIVALELGGNNPLVIWNAADIEGAAKIATTSAFVSAGQRCLCARRLIVPMGAAGDSLIAAITEMAAKVRIGNPLDAPQPFIGPLIHSKAAVHVLNAQANLLKLGAEPILLATTPKGLGTAYLSPGLLDVSNMHHRSDVEIFGPLLQVIRAPDFVAAVVEANNTKFGLAAALVADDPKLFEYFRSESNAGLINFNAPTVSALGFAPFGGTGLSGNHRPTGYYAADYCSYPVATYRPQRGLETIHLQGFDD